VSGAQLNSIMLTDAGFPSRGASAAADADAADADAASCRCRTASSIKRRSSARSLALKTRVRDETSKFGMDGAAMGEAEQLGHGVS
jgi:hypothetical protein